MATITQTPRHRPKHGMFVRLVTDYADDTGLVTSIRLEQKGFEDYDFVIRYGDRDALLDTAQLKGRGFTIPVDEFGGRWRRELIDIPTRTGVRQKWRNTYSLSVRVMTPRDLRGKRNLDNRLLWLLDREQYMLRGLESLWPLHDQVMLRALQDQHMQGAAHLRRVYEKWSRYNGAPIAMADFSATGQLTWSQSNNFSGSGTWAAGVSVMFAAGVYSSGTQGSTVDGEAHDDYAEANDDGDNEGSFVTIHGSPTTGTSVTNATTGVSGDNTGSAFAVTDVDVSEVEATGFPDTDSSIASDPTVTLTTAVADLAVCAYGSFTLAGNPPSTTPNGGDTVIYQNVFNDELGYCAYEKATGASTTVGLAFDSEGSFEALTGVVVPTISHTSELTHFRHRNDDDDEADATWRANEDANGVSVAKSENTRLRMQTDFAGDPPSGTRTVRYKKTTEPASEWRVI